MSVKAIRYAMMAMAVIAFSYAHSANSPRMEQPETFQDYSILWERNIFSRSRGVQRQEEERAQEQVKREYRPERDIVLRGVSQQGDRWVAFFENLQSGVTSRAQKGDEIARGKVQAISLDQVEYELNGQVVQVAVGQTLDGGTPEAPVDYSAFQEYMSSAPGGSSAEPSTDTEEGGEPSADEAAILEKLKRQREKELQ